LSDDQRAAILTLLVDVQTLRNDARAVEAASARLDEIIAKDPSRPEAQQHLARRKLQTAQQALTAKDYQKVLSEIDTVRTLLTEPPQQAEALFLLAEARFGLANRSDTTALKDSALAYMRVVAHFSNTPGRPYVARSLLRTAEIHELMNEKPIATRLYEQIVSQFTEDAPTVARARASLQKLKGE
jgi:outer membrane protein assembly factor BamD (BamD/ComL family)